MPQLIKAVDETLYNALLMSLIGRLIHVPTNIHKMDDGEEVNAFFAGQVAGYEVAHLAYDFKNEKYLDSPKFYYNILTTDGMGYVLSNEQCVIYEVTKEEFDIMVTEHLAKEAIKREAEKTVIQLVKPGNKILLPGDGY